MKVNSIIKAEAIKAAAKKENEKKGIHEVKKGETVITSFNGSSVRKWAEAVRAAGLHDLPKIYRFCCSLPVRSQDGKRVIVEGKYELGCYHNGRPSTLARFNAQYGYKLPTKGNAARCDELIAMYKDALAQRGKFAPKAVKMSDIAKAGK